ncbi:MAG: gpW family head-tail joining protein [Desulfobulbales bacterium]|nr:gpW family head-tail joining protein [Desulfobulbales bacterium]
MAYTSADLDEITAAIVALAKGQRVVSVRLDGKEIEYGKADLAALKSLRAEITAELATAAGTSDDYVYVSTSKGY